MGDEDEDLLWPHFAPLWIDLRQVTFPDILLAGGYGLFLKQRWLWSNFHYLRDQQKRMVGD